MHDAIVPALEPAMNSIVFESVHKVFRQRGFFFLKQAAETHALKGISLTVSGGEVLGLLGPNGSGKSTTLKLISTMLLPDEGEVLGSKAGTPAATGRKCVEAWDSRWHRNGLSFRG